MTETEKKALDALVAYRAAYQKYSDLHDKLGGPHFERWAKEFPDLLAASLATTGPQQELSNLGDQLCAERARRRPCPACGQMQPAPIDEPEPAAVLVAVEPAPVLAAPDTLLEF